VNRIHPESPDHPQQLRIKRLINAIGESYWKHQSEPTRKARKQHEDYVKSFDRMLTEMRMSKNGVW